MSFLSMWLGAPRVRRRTSRSATGRSRLTVEILEDRLVFAVNINVDALANVHAINADIYGLAFADTNSLNDLNATINRSGGNAETTYNWLQNATNRAADYYFESIADGPNVAGQKNDQFIAATKAAGAQPDLTIPLIGYAAKVSANRGTLASFAVSKYGAQQATDPNNSNFGNGVRPNGTFITGNNTNDAYVPADVNFQKAWVQHLVDQWGTAAEGGLRFYSLDNEASIWQEAHRDIRPVGATMQEMLDLYVSYASMIKSVDPSAQILGPEEWGWDGFLYSGYDQQYAAAHNYSSFPDRAAHGNMDYIPWLLQQIHNRDAAAGQRLLDYLTVHYYPQGGEFSNNVSQAMQLLRNQSTRSLWDPNYVDQSWINDEVRLIPRLHEWVNTYYPGTKVGLTEYNWGAEGHMNGATAQADLLGIFGRENLDMAIRWTTPAANSPAYNAFKMYRNYDGQDGAFGDRSVSATVPNPDQVSAFASVRSSDGALTIMVINKNLYNSAQPGATTSITVNFANFQNAGVAQEWQLAGVNGNQTVSAITRMTGLHFAGNSFTFSAPMQSVQIFVLAPGATAPAAPTGLSATPANGQVTLAWSAAAGASSYNIYRSLVSGGEGSTPYRTGVTSTSFTDTGLTNGTTYYYQVTGVNGAGQSGKSTEVSATASNSAPGVQNPAAAASNPVAGVSTVLTVLGRDDTGEAGLRYTWSVIGKPAGAADPTFSTNGANAAKSTTATFSQAGAYTFRVTISDGALATTSTVAVTVNQTLTTLALTPASTSVLVGGTQQFAAAARDQFGAVLAAAPTLTWSVVSGGGSITASGLYTAGAPAGPATIRATVGAVVGTATATVLPAPTTTTVASSGASSQAGQAVTFTANVTSNPVGSITGTVTFRDGSATLGTVALSNGQATFTTSSLSVAGHTITAVYNGSTGHGASTSTTLTQTVTQATSSTTLTANSSSTLPGQSVLFTATVATSSGVAATGNVTFRDGSTTLGTVALSNGQGSLATSALSLGGHTITATYAGDVNVSGSASAARTHTVTAAPATVPPFAADYTNLGGFVKQVEVAQNQNGTLQVFAIGGDNALWTRTQTAPGGAFSAWTSLGGYVTQIITARDRNNALQVFAIGGDNALWTRTQTAANAASFTGWSSLGGFVKQIAGGVNLNGALTVYAIGGDNAAWFRMQGGTGSAFGNWTSLGGFVKQLTVTADGNGTQHLFAIGGDNAAWRRVQAGANSTSFADWQSLGGYVKQLAAGRNANGTVRLFAIGGDNAAWMIAQSAVGGAFINWSSLGGYTTQIRVSTNLDGGLLLIAIGGDGALYTKAQAGANGAFASGYIGLGGVVKQVAAGSNVSGAVQLFAVGGDDALYTKAQTFAG